MDKSVKSFLDLIAWSEGTSTSHLTKNNGYDVIVTGIHGPAIFTDYSDHPFAKGGGVEFRPGQFSTASGRYQVLAKYFEVYKKQLNLSDFSPSSQDSVAIQQIKEKKALAMIENGNISDAIHACASIWASFPGNSYGQGGHNINDLLTKYNELLKG